MTKIFYLLFLFLFLSGSSISIGGIAIRYLVILLLLMQVFLGYKKYPFDKCWKLYVPFILCFGFSCMATNYTGEFVNSLFKQYFMAFVVWLSTVVILTKDRSFVKYIFVVYLLVGIFDVIVTYSQFTFNTAWYEPIESFFRFMTNEEFSDMGNQKSSYMDVNDGTLQGMFGNGALNGYYLSVCAVLSMLPVIKTKNIFWLILPTFFLFGSFICQQRAPLFISLLAVLTMSWLIFNRFSSRNRFLMFILIAIAITFGLTLMSDFSDAMGLRYSVQGTDSTGRDQIMVETFDYIASHPFLPNIHELIAQKGHAPHNLFLNAFIYGGFISFVLILSILFIQTRQTLFVIKNGIDGIKAYYFTVAFAWATFTMNCMVHNRSVVTGDFTIWLLWGILCTYPIVNPKGKL